MQDPGGGEGEALGQAAGLYLSEIGQVMNYLLTARPWCGLWYGAPDNIG